MSTLDESLELCIHFTLAKSGRSYLIVEMQGVELTQNRDDSSEKVLESLELANAILRTAGVELALPSLELIANEGFEEHRRKARCPHDPLKGIAGLWTKPAM